LLLLERGDGFGGGNSMIGIKKVEWCAAVGVVSLVALLAAAATQQYKVTDLGAVAGQLVSGAYGLNNLGQAAGVSSDPGGAIATLFAGGKATSLGTLVAGDVSIAEGISSTGQVVGYVVEYPASGTVYHAFLYSNANMQDIDSASLFPSGTVAYGINSSEQVVGEGYVNSYTFHPFLYSGGKMTDIGTLGGFQASATAINAAGVIVGNSLNKASNQHAFMYANGKMTDLGVPSGSYAAGANAINASNDVAGTIYLTAGGSHAASYIAGEWTDLGLYPGAIASSATGINASNQIVGTGIFAQTSYHPPKPGKHVPFLVSGGALVNLNTLIPTGSGFTLTDAIAINDAGQILCDATNASGLEHAVLLTP
jgi:probable HAF family extracellular repeat protein